MCNWFRWNSKRWLGQLDYGVQGLLRFQFKHDKKTVWHLPWPSYCKLKDAGYHLVFCETDSIAVQHMITQESQSRINMLLIPSIWAFSTMIGSYPLSTICMKGTCVHIGWQNHQHNLPRAFLFDYELLSAQASFVISWCYGFCFSEAVAILLFCSLSFIHIKNNIKNY